MANSLCLLFVGRTKKTQSFIYIIYNELLFFFFRSLTVEIVHDLEDGDAEVPAMYKTSIANIDSDEDSAEEDEGGLIDNIIRLPNSYVLKMTLLLLLQTKKA